MDLYEIKNSILKTEHKLNEMKNAMNFNALKEEIGLMKKEINTEDFWDNPQKASVFVKKYKSRSEIISDFQMTSDLIEEAKFLLSEMSEEISEIEIIHKKIITSYKQLEVQSLLFGEHDNSDAFLEIHPGAGGVESHDFAEMIMNMYIRYINKSELDYKIIDLGKGEVAGIKSVVLKVTGANAFGLLKGESGIHRLIRISPFDSGKRRHTSFASVKLTPVLENSDIEISEKDLKIDTFRSTGAGGQSVNTTDSAVRIKHLPSGIIVTCQNERSQIQNKESAMEVLKAKISALEEEKNKKQQEDLTGVLLENGFGSQKRSYTLHPYKLVKDHISKYQTTQVDKVLNGEIDNFLLENLLSKKRSINE